MNVKHLEYKTYHNKVLGCWLGKCIGGSFGAPVEGIKQINSLKYYSKSENAQIANDDLDIQLVWVHALKEHGLNISSYDMMQEWMSHMSFPWNEYGYATRNFRCGIVPSASGEFNNSFFGESMGCPIRSEIWGLIAPGDPDLAAAYAKKDATLDHFKESVYAEMFLATIESMAFFENDIEALIDMGLSFIPSSSRLAQCINFVKKSYNENKPMMVTRRNMLNRFGHPDNTNSTQNLGIMAIALLYGRGDFESTIVKAVNCGYDSDCTAATCGAILGIIYGADALPRKWVEPVGDGIVSLLDVDLLLEHPSLTGLSDETCAVGAAISQKQYAKCVIDSVPQQVKSKADAIANAGDRDLSVSIRYDGVPSIGFGKSVKVFIEYYNNREYTICAQTDLALPPYLKSDFKSTEFPIEPMNSHIDEVTVYIAEGVLELPVVNKAELNYSCNGNRWKMEFGFSGAAQWLAAGPFWSPLSERKVKPCRIYPHDCPNLPLVEVMMMNDVDIDEQYMKEDVLGERAFIQADCEKAVLNAPEDILPLDDVFTMCGQQAVYLLRRIKVQKNTKVWIMTGSSDALKIWVNGEKLISSNSHAFYTPLSQYAEAELIEGENTIVAKVIRQGASYDFSFMLKENTGKHWHQEHHLVDYSNLELSGF